MYCLINYTFFYFVADKLNGMFLIVIHLKSNALAQISSVENMGQGEFIRGRVLNLKAKVKEKLDEELKLEKHREYIHTVPLKDLIT